MQVVELGDDALSHLKAEKLDMLIFFVFKNCPSRKSPLIGHPTLNRMYKTKLMIALNSSNSLQHFLINSVIASTHKLLELLQT